MVDYGKTKTPSMHHRLCRATLLRLAFFEKSELNFPFEKFLWDNAVVIKKKKKIKKTDEVGVG